MTNQPNDPLTNLKQAYEAGAIDEVTYKAMAAAYVATQSGSGAIAQDGGIAAGAGGIAVGGDFQGDVYMGQPPVDDAEALAIYRRLLVTNCRRLPLRGVDVGASDPTGQKQIDLDQVYIDLDTTSTIDPTLQKMVRQIQSREDDAEQQTLSAIQAAIQNQRLVLLGGPGSGKSTFLNHLGLCLALHALEPDQQWLNRLNRWPQKRQQLIPITLILRDYAATHAQSNEPAAPSHLWDFIRERLASQNLTFAQDAIHDALEKGNALLLFDGLDEIPTRAQRTFVRDSVATFVERYPKCPAIVTCRTLSYQERAWQLDNFTSVTLAPFDREKIERFIEAWYQELQRLTVVTKHEAAALTKHLQEALQSSDLRDLAETPLLLTVMALVHTHEGRLPDARALLYEKTIDILLYRWEEIKIGKEKDAPTLRRILRDAGRENVDLKRILAQLAFDAHQQLVDQSAESKTLADIGELRLEKALASLHPNKSRDWANRLIQAIKMRAGLLIERTNELYTFPHRTFQEYLAGAHLASRPDFAKEAHHLSQQADFWRQVILFGTGRLVYVIEEPERPLPLVAELASAEAAKPPTDETEARIYWKRLWIAADILLEIGLNRVQDSAFGRDLLKRIRPRMASLIQTNLLTATERNEAASTTLLRLGDPRAEVLSLEQMHFCYVPRGPFTMGEGKEAETHDLAYGYWISRFPITNAHYQRFVDDGGYTNPAYWPEAAKAGYWQEGQFKDWSSKDFRTGPRHYGRPYDLPNHPQVGVSWYESLAFCRWLTDHYRQAGLLGSCWRVTLPNEPEWEKAARGGHQIPKKPLRVAAAEKRFATPEKGEMVPNPLSQRAYPWGDKIETERCNYGKTEINSTSAVGCFVHGQSPYSVEEMSGNVWEWNRSIYEKYPYPQDLKEQHAREKLDRTNVRVLRGSSFDADANLTRCAARSYFYPNFRDDFVGFRSVVAPFPLQPEASEP